MDTADITHRTNSSFVYAFQLDDWCDLYEFTLGEFRAQMRKDVQSNVVFYEWSTDAGNMTYSETQAHGEVAFTLNPQPGDNVLIGAARVVFSDVPIPEEPHVVNIDATLAGTMANLLAYLTASTDPQLSSLYLHNGG